MIRRLIKCISAACVITGVVSYASIYTADHFMTSYATQEDIDDAKNKKSSLEEEKKKTQALLDKLSNLKSDAATYVKQLDADLEELNKQVDELNTQISTKEDEIVLTNKELDEAIESENEQYDSMKLRIKYMYEKGDTGLLDMLFQSTDLTNLLNRAEYVTKISEYDRAQLDKLEETEQSISDTKDKLTKEKEEMLSLKDEVEAKQDSVNTLLADKKTELAGYDSKISSAEGDLSTYEAEIKKQESAIKAAEAEIKRREEEARKAAEAAGKSYATVDLGSIHFTWPCPSSSRITSYFGDRESPTEGASSNHQGLDIGASTGSSIVAAAAGEVIISTYSPSAGNYIMISHGGGVYTVYMHCSQLLVSTGTQVTSGQTIAKVGSTGYSTGPHLHFGIRAGGKYLNPISYVSP